MTVTTTGAEFNRFCADQDFWPKHVSVSFEDEDLRVNGKRVTTADEYYGICSADVVTIKGGIVYHPELKGRPPSYETYFKRWRDAQTRQTFQVECDSSVLDAVLAAIKAAGGKTVR